MLPSCWWAANTVALCTARAYSQVAPPRIPSWVIITVWLEDKRDTSVFVLYRASILFSGHFLRLCNVMKHPQALQSQGIERDAELQLKLLKPLFLSTYTCSKICYAISDHRHDFLRKPQTSLKVPRGFISHCKLLPSLQNCWGLAPAFLHAQWANGIELRLRLITQVIWD